MSRRGTGSMPDRMPPALAHFCPCYAPHPQRKCSRRSCRNRGAQAGHCVINIFQNKRISANALVGAYTMGCATKPSAPSPITTCSWSARDGTFDALVPETCASRSRGRACSVGRSRNSRHTNAGRSRLFRHRSKSSGKDGLLSIGASLVLATGLPRSRLSRSHLRCERRRSTTFIVLRGLGPERSD